MSNLSITSVIYHDTVNSSSRPSVEISGEWLGENQPPRILKNIYKNDNDHLMQDIFHKTEQTLQIRTSSTASFSPRLHASNPQFNYGGWVVSYRFINSLDITPVEIVSDFVFGQDKDEYVAWNLLSRRIRSN